MGKIIGVVPAAFLGDQALTTKDDYYKVCNNYAK